MRRLRVTYQQSAKRDLQAVADYLFEQGASLDTTLRYVGRIESACARIGGTPGMGNAREDLGPGLRMTGFERRASIVFKVEAERVLIVNVFYGGRDVDGFYRRRRGEGEAT